MKRRVLQASAVSNEQDAVDGAVALTYQSIGEFVVAFQWIEDMYRQIGWFILDPERKSWPPMQLRTESNEKLIDKVTAMFMDLTRRREFPGGAERATSFAEFGSLFHDLRKYRNRLLHSTFVEMKVGDQTAGYLRSNPKIGVDPDSGELIYDQESVSAERIRSKIAEYAPYVVRLGQH
ncbi:MAG: hypothetical protein ACYDAE_22470 [Steroidobacteraceae bacterium]